MYKRLVQERVQQKVQQSIHNNYVARFIRISLYNRIIASWNLIISKNVIKFDVNLAVLPLFILGKLRTSKIDCGDKIQKKPCLLTFSREK